MGEGAVFDAEQRMVPADPGRYRELVAGLDREVAEARKAGTVTVGLLRRAGVGHLVLRELAEAEELLTEALWLRREKEDPELLASTEQALAYCRRRAREAGAADAGAVREGGEGVRRG